MDGEASVREYYRTIDDGDYDGLAALLAEGFVHERPDRTLEGREAFVAFMRSGRPATDTEHEVTRVYACGDADTRAATGDGDRYAAEGRLIAGDGTVRFGFVDAFLLRADGIRRLTTYTDRHPV